MGRILRLQVSFFLSISSALLCLPYCPGISNVASHPSVRGQGFGILLTKSIRDFVSAEKKTSVGFCLHANSNFYSKCGWKIIENAISEKSWFYKTPEGNIHVNTWDEDVLYVEEEGEGLMTEVLAHPEIPVAIPKNYW
jgi:hypothetical protein